MGFAGESAKALPFGEGGRAPARSGEVPCRFAQLHRQELEPLPSRLRRATFPKGEGIASLNSSLSSDFSRGGRGEPCDFGDVRVPSPGRG